MTKTIWVDTTGASTTYVPREKPIQESVAPFSGTISGAAPATTNLGTNSGQRILAADGTWIPQPAFTSGGADQLETLRPSVISTSYSANPPTVTDSAKAYDSDTNHATTFGQWYAAQEARTNNRVDIFSLTTWASKTQTWTAATINVSRSYAILQDGESASVDGLSSKTSSVKYEFSTNNGSSWTTLGTDTQSSIPTAPQTLSMALGTLTPTMGNILIKVTITRGGGGTIYEDGVSLPGLTGEVDLKLFDVWIDGTYAGGAGNITCNNLTVTGDATFQNKIYDSTASAGTTGQVLKVAANGKVTWATDSAGSGTVTSITTTGANGVTISGGSTQTITTSGTFALALGNITPTSISTGTGSFSGDVEFSASIKSPNGSNSPVTIVPDGTGDLHVNADSLRLGDNNADATIATNGTGDLILTTHEGSATEGVIRLYDGANGNITLTPNGTGQVQVGSDQVVTLAASQTLTNKSISGSTNTFSNIPNSATTATSANTASAIVARDASGNFSAGTITATLSGNATNVTGTVAVANGGTGLTTLTAGYIPYGAGTSAFGSSANLFWDSANSRLGIGTVSPSTYGDVVLYRAVTGLATIAITQQNAATNDGAKFSVFYQGTELGNYGYYWDGGQFINKLGYYGTLTFNSNSSEQMRLNSTGLGIGNTPSYKLDVSGTIHNNNAVFISHGVQGNSSGITFSGVGSNYGRVWEAANDRWALGYAGSFGGASTEALNWNNSGNVGIGVAPSAWQTSSYKVLQISEGGAAFWGQTDAVDADISTNAYIDSSYQFRYIKAGAATWYRALDGYFYWNTASSGSANGAISFSERMRLTIDGSLGIGTSSPLARLSIYTGSAGTLMTLQGSGTQFGFAQNVVGGANTCEIQTRDTTTLTLATRYLIRGGTDTANHEWYSGARGSESCKMFLEASTGNLGIGVGTASPSAKLTVNSGANRQIYIGQNTSNSNYNAISLNGSLSDSGLMGLAGGGTGDETLYVMSQGNMVFRTVGTNERMRITSGGNLLIGATSQAYATSGYMLGVQSGGAQTFISIAKSGQTLDSGGMIIGLDAGGGYVWNRENINLYFGTNNTERMRITSGGELLIGTSSATYGGQLTVRGSGITVASFMNSNFVAATSGTQLNVNVGATTGNTNFQLQVNSGGGLAFNDLCLQPSGGNLLIGNTNGTEKLTVTGNIRASGVFVGNGSSGSYTKGFGGIYVHTSAPTSGSAGDHHYVY